MGTLVFVGLGLWDERDITLRGYDEARSAQVLFAEFYTSRLLGTNKERMERLLGKPITILTREQVEDGRLILAACRSAVVALLVPGDPMTATTHVDLLRRVQAEGVPTRVINGPSIFTAAPGLLGLQIYKFGRTTTLPFTTTSFHPTSPLEAIAANLGLGLHTLVLLDLQEGEYLSAENGLRYLLEIQATLPQRVLGEGDLACVLSRVGSPDPLINVGTIGELIRLNLGGPLQCMVIPGKLHFQEEEALNRFRSNPVVPL